MTVIAHFLRLQRLPLIVWSLVALMVVGANAASLGAVVGDTAMQDLLKTLPPALQKLTGGDFSAYRTPADGFLAMKVIMILPVLFGVFATMSTASIVAREQERGTLDFLLSLPISRKSLLRQRFLAVLAGIAALYVIAWVTLVAVVEAAGHTASYGRFAIALLGYYTVNVAQAGIALVFSLKLREYGQAVRAGLVLVVALFLFDMVLQAADVLAPLRWFLLYGLIDLFAAVRDGALPWAGMLICLGIALGCYRWSEAHFIGRNLQG